MSNQPNLDSEIAIVGAGIGGLALALALAQAGARQVSLFERRPDFQEIGAGLQIGPNATRMLAQLGLAEQLHAVSARSPDGQMYAGATGNKLATLPMDRHAVTAYGVHSYQLLRADLHRILLEALTTELGQSPVRFGKELVEIYEEERPRLTFSDGTEVQADLVIGADGVESKVRSLIFKDANASYSGYFAWRGLINAETVSSAPELSDRLSVWIGEGRHLIAYPLCQGKLINLVGVSESPEWQAPNSAEDRPVSDWLDDYRGWNRRVLSLIGCLASCQKWSLRTIPELHSWHSGSVSLLGDAAHPMLPSLAQGAAQAVEDALCLAELIGQGERSTEALFANYFDSRVEPVRKIQQMSLWNLRFFHRSNDLFTGLRNLGMRVGGPLTSKIIAEKYRWLYQS